MLRLEIPQAGSLKATVEVYDWTTGALVHTWPLTLSRVAPIEDRLSVSGRIAVVSGAFKLRLLDLTTGNAATIAASRADSPATIGSRGLVYAVNPNKEVVLRNSSSCQRRSCSRRSASSYAMVRPWRPGHAGPLSRGRASSHPSTSPNAASIRSRIASACSASAKAWAYTERVIDGLA